MVVNATRERAIERIPVVPRRHAWPGLPARRWVPAGFRHVQAIEEPVLPFEPFHLGAPDKIVARLAAVADDLTAGTRR